MTYSNGLRYSPEQAQRLIDGFFGDYLNEQNGYIALCSSGTGWTWKEEFYSDTYFAMCRVTELYSQGCDVYFGVNPVSQPRRRANAVKNILRLHVDADFTNAEGLNLLLKLEPTAIVASGTRNRYHAYFNFPAPIATRLYGEDIRRMNRCLTKILGLKEEAFDLSRTLRVPGTANFKDRMNPRPVEIIEWKPERRYSLQQCADLIGVKLGPQSQGDEPLITLDEVVPVEMGRYLKSEDRLYLRRLLQEGLFEESSRNFAMMLLIRHFYECGYDEESARRQVTEFFELRNNGLSKEWNERPDTVRSKINSAVGNWFKKAYPASKKRAESRSKRLSRRDESFIQSQALNDRDKLFLRDTMTWILNNKRGDDVVLSVRQMTKFSNCNLGNYTRKREILYRLGILALAVEHARKTRLANEYKVLYKFGPPSKATRRGRKRSAEISLVQEVDKMLLAGASNQEVRERFPACTRQRIYSRRRRLDKEAVESRECLD